MSKTKEEKRKSHGNIEQGDYQRTSDATNRYSEQKRKKALVRRVIIISIYADIICVAAFIMYEFIK